MFTIWTREYSATLAHLSIGMDPFERILIFDDKFFLLYVTLSSLLLSGLEYPHIYIFCSSFQRICTGHWDVDFNEASYVKWWRGCDSKALFKHYYNLNFVIR